MTRRVEPASVAPFVGVACALLLLGAGAATWISEPVARSVGDVALVERRATSGVELAPLTVVAALAGVACSVGLLATRGRARRTVALLLIVAGAAGVFVVGAGMSRLRVLDGAVTAAPWLALAAAAGMLGAGLVGLGQPVRRMPARYDVGATPTDDEWQLASDAGDGGLSERSASYPSSSGATDRADGEGDQR